MPIVFATATPNTLPVWAMLLTPILSILGFIIIGSSVLWMNSRASGWHAVAQLYPAPKDFASPPSSTRSVIGMVGWRFLTSVSSSSFPTMQLTACDTGLHISMVPLLSVGFHPLFIPWERFHTPQPGFSLVQKMTRLSIGPKASHGISLPQSAYETIIAPRMAPATVSGS